MERAGERTARRRPERGAAPYRKARPLEERLYGVVLAGGAGERFWPRSRRAAPKPLLRVVGGESLLASALGRAQRVAGAGRVWMVCGAEHAAAVRSASGLPARQIVVEPRRRNTSMAVAIAAARIAALDPDAVLAVLPADHCVPDARAFADALRRAARAADAERVLVTLGVRPTRPDTGYGYILAGDAVGRAHPGLHRVRRFVEKPDAARAQRFLRHGGYLWNAGVFVWRADVLLEEIERWAPELHAALAPLEGAGRSGPSPRALAAIYQRAPSLPIDTAVLERSRRVWTLPVSFHWSDVGTWASLAEELGARGDASRVVSGDALLEDARGSLVWGDKRLIALLGVEGVAVIDTPDALLVARLDRSGDVRRLVERLRAAGREDLL